MRFPSVLISFPSDPISATDRRRTAASTTPIRPEHRSTFPTIGQQWSAGEMYLESCCTILGELEFRAKIHSIGFCFQANLTSSVTANERVQME